MTGPSSTSTWRGQTFTWVADLVPDADVAGRIIETMPQARYLNAASLPLNPYGAGPFCRFRISRRLPVAGIYIIADGDGHAMYVGECANLSARFNNGYGNISPRNCFERGQPTNCRINSLVLGAARRNERLTLWFMPTTMGPDQRRRLEAELIASLRPPWNRQSRR